MQVHDHVMTTCDLYMYVQSALIQMPLQ